MLKVGPRRLSITVLIAALILVVQVGAVAYVHLSGTNERYFAWGPNDFFVVYTITTSVDGHAWTPEQVAKSYEVPAHGTWEWPVQQLIDILKRYQEFYGTGQHEVVTLRYTLDGHPEQVWRRT
jgi:hypothetical protein